MGSPKDLATIFTRAPEPWAMTFADPVGVAATFSQPDILGRASRPGSGDWPPILVVPGLGGSGPTHWQSHWERALPGAERVDQTDWGRPTLGEWTANLVEAIRRRPGALLVAHSLGCALVAHLAAIIGGRGVSGALLVAPADVDRDTPAGKTLKGFAPMPCQRLPFPSLVVASHSDPFVAIERAEAFARAWGSAFADLGDAGHINVDSGHGPWFEGRVYLDQLTDLAARNALGGVFSTVASLSPDLIEG
jgi:predicted alpha/beta hydrolase family esterase